ncbi:unnamed protein product [Toxocara canis]|uniref:Uncharacterized protein n=1 Tax=Toxocara canis TaxID=6265 RepID=A0A183VCD7_TOXCA|nr:unnamed protein product [Toxocara canis]
MSRHCFTEHLPGWPFYLLRLVFARQKSAWAIGSGAASRVLLSNVVFKAILDGGLKVLLAVCSAVFACSARSVLSALCDAYETDAISGDLCHRLCFTRNWNISTMYERRKTVIILHMGGQKVVLKTLYASIDQYPRPDPGASQQAFVDALLDIVNNVLRLGWPSYYKRNLITLLWPKYQRMSYTPFSKADRISLWALVSQNEYVNLRALTLSRVTPKVSSIPYGVE